MPGKEHVSVRAGFGLLCSSGRGRVAPGQQATASCSARSFPQGKSQVALKISFRLLQLPT